MVGRGGRLGLGAHLSGAGSAGQGLIGDIHPDPMPVPTAGANVTSLRRYAVEVALWEVDDTFVQEPKLSGGRGGGGAEGHAPLFCQKGVAVFLGLPAGYKGGRRRGMWPTPKGGVRSW